jgi:4-hydroxy-tetrahydrodipicolinate synthase
MKSIHGVVPVIPIPFEGDESIDEASLRRTVDFVAELNQSMCLPAYGGEFYKLSEAEREYVIGVAIEQNAGRTPVLAQANHGSSKIAAELARRYESMGANVISFAIPRLFGSTDEDVLEFCGTIADAVSIPILIQDFNPGGPTIDADFIKELNRRHENFKYAKLEEPLIIDKLLRIQDQVGDAVGILEGWGGMYMLEAISCGIIGIMPGVPYCDFLQLIYDARESGDDDRAYDLFGAALPMMYFSLQDLELFLQVEKRMMVRRGLFTSHHVRALTYTQTPTVLQHAEYLIEQLLRVMKKENLH